MKTKTKERLASQLKVIDAKKAEARAKWPEVVKARDAAIAAGPEGLDPNSDVFKAADQAGREYDALRDEVNTMQASVDRLVELDDGDKACPGGIAETRRQNAVRMEAAGRAIESIMERNVEDFMDSFRAWKDSMGGLKSPTNIGSSPSMKLISREDFQAALTMTTAYPSLPWRRPGIVPLPTEGLQLIDLINWVPTDSNTVEYVYEKTFDRSAVAETAEGEAAGEGAVDFDKGEVSCKWIPFMIPNTFQILDDEPRLRAWIQNRMVYGVRSRLQNQAVNGDGRGNNIRGFARWSGVLSHDVGSDSDALADAIHKAKTKIRIQTRGQYEPTTLCMYPEDEELLMLSKDEVKQYYFGGPQRETVTVWGMTPVSHVNIAKGSPLVADMRAVEGYIREDVTLAVTDSNENHFEKGIIDFRASGRFGLVVLQPKAICELTSFES